MDVPPRLFPMVSARTIVPVLLAGGTGSRLWPLSREQYPKQFHALLGRDSLFQDTLARGSQLDNALGPVIIGAEPHRFVITEQLREAGIRDASILLEPDARNTAPAVAVAAHYVLEHYGPEALVFVMAADHAIGDLAAFNAAVNAAAEVAERGHIVTFGIRPTRAETGFGYLKAGSRIGTGPAHLVDRFVEKPNAERARQFVEQGDHYWNGGMFLFRSGQFLAELRQHEPATYERSREAIDRGRRDKNVVCLDAKSFAGCRAESVDYAVMEKCQQLALVPLDADWDDVGSWTFLERLPEADGAGNHLRGDVLTEGASGNLVHAGSRLVAMVGVKDLVVVETEDAVLVVPRDRVQDVKKLVQQLKRRRRSEAEMHRRVYRPWGYYETVAFGERFQVKRISVKPGEQLSLQMHYHRAEHWVVVKGTAMVTCGERRFIVSENESTFIPTAQVHRLENPGRVTLELIEVQSGTYLGEDDIVRMSDRYGRSDSKSEAPATQA